MQPTVRSVHWPGRTCGGFACFPPCIDFPCGSRAYGRFSRLPRRKPGVVVFVHCGVLTVGVRAKLGLPSPFDMSFSNPLDLHAVALEFPKLNFVVPHFGAGYFREALMLCDLCPNVYLDTSSSNSWLRYQARGSGPRGRFSTGTRRGRPQKAAIWDRFLIFPAWLACSYFSGASRGSRKAGD